MQVGTLSGYSCARLWLKQTNSNKSLALNVLHLSLLFSPPLYLSPYDLRWWRPYLWQCVTSPHRSVEIVPPIYFTNSIECLSISAHISVRSVQPLRLRFRYNIIAADYNSARASYIEKKARNCIKSYETSSQSFFETSSVPWTKVDQTYNWSRTHRT